MTDLRQVSVGALFFQSFTFVCHCSPVNFCPPLAVAHIRQLAAAAPGHGMQHDSCRQLLARALPGRAAVVLCQAAIAAGIITEGRSPGSRLRKPVAAQPQ